MKIQARLASVDKFTMQGITTQSPVEIRVFKGVRRLGIDVDGGRMVMQIDRENGLEFARQIILICLAIPQKKER